MTINWHNDTRRLADLIPWEHNPKQLTEQQAAQLETSNVTGPRMWRANSES